MSSAVWQYQPADAHACGEAVVTAHPVDVHPQFVQPVDGGQCDRIFAQLVLRIKDDGQIDIERCHVTRHRGCGHARHGHDQHAACRRRGWRSCRVAYAALEDDAHRQVGHRELHQRQVAVLRRHPSRQRIHGNLHVSGENKRMRQSRVRFCGCRNADGDPSVCAEGMRQRRHALRGRSRWAQWAVVHRQRVTAALYAHITRIHRQRIAIVYSGEHVTVSTGDDHSRQGLGLHHDGWACCAHMHKWHRGPRADGQRTDRRGAPCTAKTGHGNSPICL